MTQVHGHTAFVAVDTEVVATFATFKWGPPGPRIIADLRLFDFDDIGTHVTEHLGAIGTGECA